MFLSFYRSDDSVDEVVKDDVNGIIFDTSDDLYQALIVLPCIYQLTEAIVVK
jgi:hypothetical protein